MDEWKATWEWAKGLLGEEGMHLFRRVAWIVAEREEWEEVGSSDVWHINFDTVRLARERGVTTGPELRAFVLDWQGISEREVC